MRVIEHAPAEHRQPQKAETLPLERPEAQAPPTVDTAPSQPPARATQPNDSAQHLAANQSVDTFYKNGAPADTAQQRTAGFEGAQNQVQAALASLADPPAPMVPPVVANLSAGLFDANLQPELQALHDEITGPHEPEDFNIAD